MSIYQRFRDENGKPNLDLGAGQVSASKNLLSLIGESLLLKRSYHLSHSYSHGRLARLSFPHSERSWSRFLPNMGVTSPECYQCDIRFPLDRTEGTTMASPSTMHKAGDLPISSLIINSIVGTGLFITYPLYQLEDPSPWVKRVIQVKPVPHGERNQHSELKVDNCTDSARQSEPTILHETISRHATKTCTRTLPRLPFTDACNRGVRSNGCYPQQRQAHTTVLPHYHMYRHRDMDLEQGDNSGGASLHGHTKSAHGRCWTCTSGEDLWQS